MMSSAPLLSALRLCKQHAFFVQKGNSRKLFQVKKDYSKFVSCSCASFQNFSSSHINRRSSDVELSYTTYPDQDHEDKVDKSKTPVVFLHGLFGAKGNLHSICKHLSANGRKIVPFDARNHGDSEHHPEMSFHTMADDLLGLIQDVKLDKPVVMGHSLGGKTAMTAALHKPDSMCALIVADVVPKQSPNLKNIKIWAEAMKNVEIPTGTSLIQARLIARTKLDPVFKNPGILQFLLTNLKDFGDGIVKWRVNLDAIINSADIIGGFPVEGSVPFTKPTLFVYGQNSEHYKTFDKGLVKSLFPKAEVQTIPDAGHFLHADKPLDFVKIVNDFLESVDCSFR